MTALAMRMPVAHAAPHHALQLSKDIDAADAGQASVLQSLCEAHPHWAEPALQLAQLHRTAARLDAARRCYREVLRRDPLRHEALLALGAMYVAAGDAVAAEPLLRSCCEHHPADAAAHHTLGIALLLLEQPEAACDTLARAHAIDPGNALCAVHLSDAAHACGLDAAWLAAIELGHREDPANVGILTGRASVLNHLDCRDEALDTLQAATLIDPDAAVPAALYADMLARTSRQGEAETALRRALVLDAGNADAAMALSVVLMRLHRHIESLAVLQELLQRDVPAVGPLCNMTTALVALGRQDEAVACARRAIATAPDHPAPRRALCNALPYQHGIGGQALLAAAQDCAARQPRDAVATFANIADPARRLKIGLLSGTLRTHPVGWLTVAAFEQLDRDRNEIICLAHGPPEDAFARRFAAIATSWEDVGGRDDAALAQHIRALGIDVLIDLGGYGDLGRMQVCARRPAPVQIKWVGMQNHSTGMPEMDWFITDRWETPPTLAGLYSEKLLLLPDGYVCYAPPDDAPPVAVAPAVRSGAITFGCYNNLAKLTPQVIAVWARILDRAARSRLILKTHQFNDAATRTTLHDSFAAHGIDPARILMRGSSPHREVLRQYCDIDLVLDPFPYSGGLTTCEALWMGVPTLTMPGETFASRHSSSHMCNVGLPDFVVPDIEAYVAQALDHAADPTHLAILRIDLRETVRRSPLCDAPRFGVALEQALRAAWSGWCRAQQRPNIYRSL